MSIIKGVYGQQSTCNLLIVQANIEIVAIKNYTIIESSIVT